MHVLNIEPGPYCSRAVAATTPAPTAPQPFWLYLARDFSCAVQRYPPFWPFGVKVWAQVIVTGPNGGESSFLSFQRVCVCVFGPHVCSERPNITGLAECKYLPEDIRAAKRLFPESAAPAGIRVMFTSMSASLRGREWAGGNAHKRARVGEKLPPVHDPASWKPQHILTYVPVFTHRRARTTCTSRTGR